MNDAAMYHRPTWRERLRSGLGFRYHRTDLPDGIDATHPGWMLTTTRLRFSVLDRLRLLISSELHVEIRQATTQQVDEAVNATSFHIKAPF